MDVRIDDKSGLCFGVVNAVKTAEQLLQKYGTLYCLGEIVHNSGEIERLKKKGLIIIYHDDLKRIFNSRILIRAHGEPPETYRLARENNNELVDATCPVVLKLQEKIKKGYSEQTRVKGQVVIFGKEGHAEVIGLIGQTDGNAIVVGNDFKALDRIDFTLPINLYSQTTQSIDDFNKLVIEIKSRIANSTRASDSNFRSFDTICRQVANRGPHLAGFAKNFDLVIFVSGKQSSNGMYLYNICKQHNHNTHMISAAGEINKEWLVNVQKVGICGATSTPQWLMEETKDYILELCRINSPT